MRITEKYNESVWLPSPRSSTLVLSVLALLIWCAPAHAERRVALVIGNGGYATAPLKNPVNDARGMAAALKSLGFEVSLVTDATMQQMETAVREFGQKLRQGGVGLFYYAGHGVQVAGENYLIPVNAVIQSEGDVKFGALNAGLVLAKMEDAGNGVNVVILDACRSNPYARSFRTAEQGLAKMDAPTGSLIAYSTSPGKVASDGGGKNGLYTHHLLNNIATPGLSVEELFKRVRQGVAGDSAKKQVPWEASSLIGQFSFAGSEQIASLGPSVQHSSGPAYTAPATPALPSAPQATDVDFGGIEKKSGERAKAEAASKKQWADWLAGMKVAMAQAQALEKKSGVSASDKAEAWLLLASKFTQKSPYGDEDEALRARMAAQANYWTTQAGKEAAAQAKTEEARQAAERKRAEDAQRLAQAKADAEAAAAAKKQQQLLALAPVPKQAPGAASGGSPGQAWRDPVTQMEFVWVPGGSFEMGCGSWTSDCADNEKPVHTVRLSGFWLGKFEVTQGQWKRVMGSNPSYFKKGKNYPVEQVSWNDVKEFITKLNAQGSAKFRLPTEAEWEYAARSGGRPEKYAGGNDIDRVAWYTTNSGDSTHAVGTKAPNGLGLYDMSGNVVEWCEDAFGGLFSSYQDPVPTDDWSHRVGRGGSWSSGPRFVRSADRGGVSPGSRFFILGFRLARIN